MGQQGEKFISPARADCAAPMHHGSFSALLPGVMIPQVVQF